VFDLVRFLGRGLLVGPLLHQAERVSFNPLVVLGKYSWDLSQARAVLEFFLELVPLAFLYWKYRVRAANGTGVRFLLIFSIFAPLILGRVLSNSFGHQYSPILICAVAAFLFVPFRSIQVPARAVGITFAVFLLFLFQISK